MGRRSCLLGKLAVAVQIASGWGVLLLITCGITVSVMLATADESASRRSRYDSGQPVPSLLALGGLVMFRTAAGETTYTDADGRVLHEPKLATALDLGAPTTSPSPRAVVSSLRDVSYLDETQPTADWYQVWPHGQRAGWYLVAFSRSSRRPVAWVARRGLVTTAPAVADWFSAPRSGRTLAVPLALSTVWAHGDDQRAALTRFLLPTSDGVWLMRPRDQHMEILVRAPGVVAVGHQTGWPGTSGDRPEQVAARTFDRVIVASSPDWQPSTAILPPSVALTDKIRVSRLNDGRLAAFVGAESAPGFDRLLRFAADGSLVSETRLPAAWIEPATPSSSPDDWVTPLMAALSPSSALVATLVPGASSPIVVSRVRRMSLPLSLLLTPPFVALTMRRQRRHRARHTWAWAASVAAFGPLFWLGYLGHRRWDAVL